MTEDEAKALALTRVPRETFACLERYAALLTAAAANQNLVSPASLPCLWARHIVDSAQLSWHCHATTPLLDIGSGAGLPGLVLAILLPGPVTLVEPRALRAAFLRDAVAALGLGKRVNVTQMKIERMPPVPFATITARAVASLDALFVMAAPFAAPDTHWILPRGQSAAADVAAAAPLWHGTFDMVPSTTDSTAAIVLARNVRPRRTASRDLGRGAGGGVSRDRRGLR